MFTRADLCVALFDPAQLREDDLVAIYGADRRELDEFLARLERLGFIARWAGWIIKSARAGSDPRAFIKQVQDAGIDVSHRLGDPPSSLPLRAADRAAPPSRS